MAAGLRISTRHLPDEQYEGEIRRGNKVVYACGHLHRDRDRDHSTMANGQSAADCIHNLIVATRQPRYADGIHRMIRRAPKEYTRMCAASSGAARCLEETVQRNLAAFDRRIADLAS